MKSFYSKGIVIIRRLIIFFSMRYKIIYSEAEQTPAVYIVHHQNLKGPITAIVWLKTNLHMWVLSPFLNRKSCFNHYMNYTFTKRFGMPVAIARIIVYPISVFVAWLLNAIKAIPVYRGKKDIILSFRQSISALLNGESLLISPDINYTDNGSNMGEMYDGFLSIDKFYYKETNRHIAFVPMHIDKSKHTIYIGKSVYFTGNSIFKEERKIVVCNLKDEFGRLQSL